MPQAKANVDRLVKSEIALSVEIKRRKDAAYTFKMKKTKNSKPAPQMEENSRKFRD